MAKKPASLLHLHDLFQQVWEGRDRGKDPAARGEEELGPGPLLHNIEDSFHSQNIFNLTRNFQSQASVSAVQMEAASLMERGETEAAAKLLFLTQANLFQHLVLMQKYKKNAAHLAAVDKAAKERDSDKDEETDCSERDQLKFASFQDTDVTGMLAQLPASWTVVQVSVNAEKEPGLTRFKKGLYSAPLPGNPSLVVVRAEGGLVDLTACPGPNSSNCSPVLKEFADILSENTHVNRNEKNRTKYWSIRKELDNRLTALLKSVEERWLGPGRAQLLGQLREPQDAALLEKAVGEACPPGATERQRWRLRTLLSASPFLQAAELEAGVAAALGPAPCPPRLHAISAALSKLREAPRHPVVLVLDPEVQGLPWESLPSLRACRQAASRVPSLAFLHSLWRSHATSRASVINTGVSTDSVFYVVNPDGNLPDTQQRLDKAFQDFKRWEGVKGTEPSKDQLERVLQDKDAYMFCGHGSGSKFLSGDEVEKLRVHAVPVLLGCSSGQLARHGRSLDPIGTVQSFLVASSPAIVGFLWAVTDADVDQWTVTFLQHWLGGKKDGQAELLQACADKRSSFKQVLNGAALVVYGLPLRSQR